MAGARAEGLYAEVDDAALVLLIITGSPSQERAQPAVGYTVEGEIETLTLHFIKPTYRFFGTLLKPLTCDQDTKNRYVHNVPGQYLRAFPFRQNTMNSLQGSDCMLNRGPQ